jgi:hypothetical protein
LLASRKFTIEATIFASISAILIVAGLAAGKDALQHAGAFVTFLGLLLGILMIRERTSLQRAFDVLNRWTADPQQVNAAVSEVFPPATPDKTGNLGAGSLRPCRNGRHS